MARIERRMTGVGSAATAGVLASASESSGGLIQRAASSLVVFFFQAEDGIRDLTVTGVQTCALPIFGSASSSLPTPLPSAICPVPNRLARASAFSASASVPVVADCAVVTPVPNRSARALRFLISSSIDDAERPILRSTAEASLVSVVAEPSRDVRAGCGGGSDALSAQTTAVRRSDWRGGVALTSSGLPALSALGGALPLFFEGWASAATAGATATASDVLVGSGATSKPSS